MVAIGVWRHIVRKLPLRYHPSYWALVFPLGMYGAATFKMRAVVKLEELAWVPKVTLVDALTAWTAAFIGMLTQAARAGRGAIGAAGTVHHRQ
jgi:tellurite resistance protein TehA-like permease